jgi:hypothetical protein
MAKDKIRAICFVSGAAELLTAVIGIKRRKTVTAPRPL